MSFSRQIFQLTSRWSTRINLVLYMQTKKSLRNPKAYVCLSTCSFSSIFLRIWTRFVRIVFGGSRALHFQSYPEISSFWLDFDHSSAYGFDSCVRLPIFLPNRSFFEGWSVNTYYMRHSSSLVRLLFVFYV